MMIRRDVRVTGSLGMWPTTPTGSSWGPRLAAIGCTFVGGCVDRELAVVGSLYRWRWSAIGHVG